MERDYLSSLLNLFRKRINKIFVGLLVIIIAACDFESPSDFVVPTWFIDIKLPLISKRFPMGDLVDTTNFIFPTDDSAGFQILFRFSAPVNPGLFFVVKLMKIREFLWDFPPYKWNEITSAVY